MRDRHSAAGAGRISMGLIALAMLLPAVLLFGYNVFQDNLGTVQTPLPVVPRWSTLPVEWLLNPDVPSNNVSGCSGSLATCIQDALTLGFSTWTTAQVAGQTLTDLTTKYAGSSTLTSPNVADCQNVIGFSDTTSSDFPTGVIAFTQVATVTASSPTAFPFSYSCSGGVTKTCNFADCLADSDIEFNPNVNFVTSSTPSTNSYSLQSVATHEEGHFLGLDHSGIGHTVMFPFGDTTSAGEQLNLSTDDAIGISYLYPCTSSTTGNCTGVFTQATGTISGTVNLSGNGVFAAHVVVVDTSTGNVVTDRLTNPDGTYSLVGVPPGNYDVLALPLSPNSDSGWCPSRKL
ncbi:MAG: matrixin family metalloprotease [Acidobacteriota bacterium]